MRKYFTTDGETNYGPFTLDELKEQPLRHDTKVWYSGLSDWTDACRIEELTDMFESIPPPAPASVSATAGRRVSEPEAARPTPPPMPATWLPWAIAVTVLCCNILGIVGIIYAAQVESAYRRGDYDLAREYSDKAGMWTLIAFVAGLLFAVLYVVLIVASGSFAL